MQAREGKGITLGKLQAWTVEPDGWRRVFQGAPTKSLEPERGHLCGILARIRTRLPAVQCRRQAGQIGHCLEGFHPGLDGLIRAAHFPVGPTRVTATRPALRDCRV